MPTTIIDLDELLPEPKEVRLGGQIYTLPPEIPVPLYLRLKREEQRAQEEGVEKDQIEDVYNEVLELFQVHNPDMEELPVGMLQLLKIIPKVYYGLDGEEPEDEDPPKPTAARTGNASTTPRRTRSRS